MQPHRRSVLLVAVAVFVLPHAWLILGHADSDRWATIRYHLLHSAVLLALNLIPVASVAGWYCWKERRNLWVETVALMAATIGLQVLARGIWALCIPEMERRARAGEIYQGPILLGIALLPLLGHALMKRSWSWSWTLPPDLMLSACGVVCVLVYELGL